MRREHLHAALAVWQYVEASVEHVFGQTLGDVLADDILHALRASPAGLTRAEIRELVGTRRTALEIDKALGRLARLGLAAAQKAPTGAPGRPAVRWLAQAEDDRRTS